MATVPPRQAKLRGYPRSASRPGLRRSPRDTSYRTSNATTEGLPSLEPPGKRPLESPILEQPTLYGYGLSPDGTEVIRVDARARRVEWMRL